MTDSLALNAQEDCESTHQCSELCPDRYGATCLSRFGYSLCIDEAIISSDNCAGSWRDDLQDEKHPVGVCVYNHLSEQLCVAKGYSYHVSCVPFSTRLGVLTTIL